ncbi:hypothetical protein GIB67_019282 [Kingdonia uniflora]|uniref:Aminotransferase-like plant mobile domain-containing protein n=1 Tax=Kingdonia uniflora TaxID=39325 RepID=A0A7J7N047_9MAGN|nr:hypothetical protein GIB67_019282 [Kingdonia uniflora]
MGHLWLQTTNDTVPLGYFTILADLDEATQYDWGFDILASLYHGFDTAVTTGGAITRFSQLLEYWFYEYCGVGLPIVKEEVKFSAYPRLRAWERGNKKKTNDQAGNLFMLETAVSEIEDILTAKLLSRKRMPLQVPNGNCKYYLGDRCWRLLTEEAHIPLDCSLSMSSHISPAALHEMKQVGFLDLEQFVIGEERETYASYWAKQTLEVGPLLTDSQRMGNIELFGPSTLRVGITPMVVTSASVHSLSHDFSLPEARGARPGSVRDAQRIQDLTDELVASHRHINNINDQLYSHDLHLMRGRDVRVVPLSPGGGARTMQRGSGLRTRGGGTSRRRRGTGDDYK